jgi:hypothetical protein
MKKIINEMELKYVWIDDYKNLKKIGFNFNHSENENFEFKNGELLINENNDNTPKGFFDDNILGITGIVGKNGSGKTNLAEFINYNLAHVSDTGLAYWGGNNKGIIILGKWIFVQKDITIKNIQKLKDQGYKENKYNKNPLDSGRGEFLWNSMERNRYIYYSSSFDFRFIKVRINLTNISTGYLAFNDLYDSIKHEKDNSRLYNRTKVDSLQAHYRDEKLRESNFIINYPDEIKRLVGQLPTDMIISIDHARNNQLLSIEYPTDDEEKSDPKKKTLSQNISDIYDIERKLLSQINIIQYKVNEPKITGYDVYEIPIEYKKDMFKNLFFIQLFKILLIDNEFPNGEFSNFIYENKITLKDKSLEKEIKTLSSYIDELIEYGDWKIELEKIENSIYYDFDDRDLHIYSLYRFLKINLDSDKKRELLNTIISNTNKITDHRINFNYEFIHQMSSGQQNFINFFSRLMWAKQNIELRETDLDTVKSERIILFIDEGEITFHPEWQRRFLKETLSMIKKIFDQKKIQLLITTHSPFVLSDLPKQNVIFLEKNKKGHAIKSTIERENTFGANIHDLLSNSFFMEATIGEFASDRIKEIVDFYYKVVDCKSEKSIKFVKDEYSSKREKFHFIVDSIGDDVIKGILENHIEFIENNLLGESYRQSRIAKLEKELKQLKRNQ